MKQFLYLDTDIVNSIIAQSEKGLIQEQSEENGSDKKKGTHISGSMEGSGTAGGSFLKLAKAEANLSLSGELGKEYVSSTTSREIISKVLHDAAFDIAYGYIKPQKFSVGKNDSGEYGDYFKYLMNTSVPLSLFTSLKSQSVVGLAAPRSSRYSHSNKLHCCLLGI